MAVDPANRLPALQNPRRLGVEFVGDKAVPDTDARQWQRGVYTHWQRTLLHPMMANFDAPAHDECVAASTGSNMPQQALAAGIAPMAVSRGARTEPQDQAGRHGPCIGNVGKQGEAVTGELPAIDIHSFWPLPDTRHERSSQLAELGETPRRRQKNATPHAEATRSGIRCFGPEKGEHAIHETLISPETIMEAP